MTIYFENSYGNMRSIAEIDPFLPFDEQKDGAYAAISNFCRERSFAIYYVRTWNVPVGGKIMTKFDVGSHTEFFYSDPPIMATGN